MAGLTLGGGLGILGRSYGVTSDRLVAAQIVLADGRVLDCDNHHHPELFWALRGAGAGNFGVVTRLVFGTVPAPQVTNFHLTWRPARAAALIKAWQGWAPIAPDELAASLKVTATGEVDQPTSVDVYGALLGTGSDATGLLNELVVRAGADPVLAWVRQLSFAETRRFWADLPVGEAAVGHGPHPHRPSTRIWLPSRSSSPGRSPPRPSPHWWRTSCTVGLQASSASWTSCPGAAPTTACASAATAFVHRDGRFQLKHAAVVDPQASTAATQAAHRWVTRSWALVHPWGSGRVFPNFPDPDLEDWAHAYYGSNYDRLVRLKARYDPADLFHFHQSLPAG